MRTDDYRCLAITKQGERCKNRVSSGAYCHLHGDATKRLSADDRNRRLVEILAAGASLILIVEEAIEHVLPISSGLFIREEHDSVSDIHDMYRKLLSSRLDDLETEEDVATLNLELEDSFARMYFEGISPHFEIMRALQSSE